VLILHCVVCITSTEAAAGKSILLGPGGGGPAAPGGAGTAGLAGAGGAGGQPGGAGGIPGIGIIGTTLVTQHGITLHGLCPQNNQSIKG